MEGREVGDLGPNSENTGLLAAGVAAAGEHAVEAVVEGH